VNEQAIQQRIMLALSERGCLIFRNNTGTATASDGSRIRFGLCVGSSDLIGVSPDGRFLAVEVKTPTGRVRPEQVAFIEAVVAAGGIAGIARSVEDAVALIASCGA
jgi:hypothetical protein